MLSQGGGSHGWWGHCQGTATSSSSQCRSTSAGSCWFLQYSGMPNPFSNHGWPSPSMVLHQQLGECSSKRHEAIQCLIIWAFLFSHIPCNQFSVTSAVHWWIGKILTKQPFVSSLHISLQFPCLRPKPSKMKTFPFTRLHFTFTIKLTSRSLLSKPQLPPGPALPKSPLPGPIWVCREEPAPDLALASQSVVTAHTSCIRASPVQPCRGSSSGVLGLWWKEDGRKETCKSPELHREACYLKATDCLRKKR